MPVSCCAVGCANRFSKESDIKFYRFPEEQGRRQLWVNAVSRAKWELKDHHRLCGEHFVSRRPSKDPEDVDYVPNVFKDGKRRRVTTKMPGREERVAKRTKNADESQEAASILLESSVSVASPSKHDSRYCETSTNTDVSFTLEDEIAVGHLCKTFLVVSLWHCYALDAPMRITKQLHGCMPDPACNGMMNEIINTVM